MQHAKNDPFPALISKMGDHVHVLMENTHHVDQPGIGDAVKQKM
jgi:hypothetical protein